MLFAYPKVAAAVIVIFVVAVIIVLIEHFLFEKKGCDKDGNSDRRSNESDDES